MPTVLREPDVARKKPADRTPPTDPTKTERVIFMASPDWVKRMNDTAESLGLSLAAFIRMSCEEKDRRMRGLPSG